MKLVALLFLCIPGFLFGQLSLDNHVSSRLVAGSSLPEKILNGRTVVLYSPNLTQNEITLIHESLVRTGVDAIAYFESDKIFAGYDTELAFQNYFTNREISCFVIIHKDDSKYQLLVTGFDARKSPIEKGQPAWSAEDKSLKEVLRMLYSTALNAYKKQNMLINDAPELGLPVNVITGRRTEAFASDLKVDKLAVPKFGDEAMDRELEEIMREYPYKYGLVENTVSEPDLRKQGYFYILRFVNTRAPAAKQLLGYDVSQVETAVASITYVNGVVQVKNIPSDIPVFKFYTRQNEFNNVYLGTKWDADVTWQKALVNFITGFKKEMRVN